MKGDVPATELLVAPSAPRHLYYLLLVLALPLHPQSVLEGGFWVIFIGVDWIFFPKD